MFLKYSREDDIKIENILAYIGKVRLTIFLLGRDITVIIYHVAKPRGNRVKGSSSANRLFDQFVSDPL